MKRFHFPLRSISVLRGHAELRAREALAAALQAQTAAGTAAAAWGERLAQMETLLASGRLGKFNAAGAAAEYRTYLAECAEAAMAEQTLLAARSAVEDRRRDYLGAHRNLKIMERAETKARTVHRAETMRVEQGELDEIAGRRAHHPHTIS